MLVKQPGYTVLAQTVKIRKSQDFLAPISGSPGGLIFFYSLSEIQPQYSKILIYGVKLQGSHRLEKYLKMKGSLEKSLKTKFVLHFLMF